MIGGSVFTDFSGCTNVGFPGPFELFRVRENLADTRAHAGVVARDQIFHVGRHRHFRRRSFQRRARLRKIDDGRVLENDPNECPPVLLERAELEGRGALTEHTRTRDTYGNRCDALD